MSPGSPPAGRSASPPVRPGGEADLFRHVMSELPSGVTVVTTMSPAGPTGMTVSAVTSLSLRPALLLICLANGSGTLARVLQRGAFAVNVLGSSMAETSLVFAQRPPHERFAGTGHRLHDGLPLLNGAVAWATCRVTITYPGGDHTIVVGAVTGAARHGGDPLVRHRGTYRPLG
ncbi:flavin reductase family protein [Streptomyces sodiiphilus]|uniref:Flavin reductase family protein n=2 Tax=Streptomyces sodiiphilus TaxID=226217 RepID=A0ABN2PVR3_9ACTN